MANAHDVAAHIAANYGTVDTIKLQKLVYYSQAWHLVAHDRPLFQEPIKAYKHGPVVGALWYTHRGMRSVTSNDFVSETTGGLLPLEAEVVDAVLSAYGSLTKWQLVELTHRERPWVDAWDNCEYDDRISHAAMMQYYATIAASPREVIDSPVPVIRSAFVSYVTNRDLTALTEDLDVPDDVSGLLAAFKAARDTQIG